MARCLRCGAGPEWLEGRVPDELDGRAAPILRRLVGALIGLSDARNAGDPSKASPLAWTEARAAVAEGRAGSRGGAPIWVMGEAWMSKAGRSASLYFSGHENGAGLEAVADPDGFAVFGRYPKGFLRHVLKVGLLGAVTRAEVLHVCSGTLSESERWTVDLRPQARPRVVADGRALPFRDASVPAVMLDPPYSDQYARNLYGVENPRPSWLLKEAARVVRPGGRIGMLHVAVPFAPLGCRLLKVYGVSTGVGFRIRAFTLYQKEQAGLAL